MWRGTVNAAKNAGEGTYERGLGDGMAIAADELEDFIKYHAGEAI